MRKKSVWLHKPFSTPKKTLFSVNENEISLGDRAFATSEVVQCKQSFPNQFFKPISLLISISLFLWMMYELLSLMLRLQSGLLLEMDPDLDVARTKERTQSLLELFHLRSSTTDDEQLVLFLWLYLGILVYSIVIANLVFRPRVYLESKSGESIEVPYILVRPRKFASTLGRARKIAKKNRKLIRRASRQ